jgi:altronate dehydratase small subunit
LEQESQERVDQSSNEQAYRAVMMKKQDCVAVALSDIPEGTVIKLVCQGQTISVRLKENMEFGHKFAVVPMAAGDRIYKYGEVIGAATRAIEVGEHVHIHNLEGLRGRGDKLA